MTKQSQSFGLGGLLKGIGDLVDQLNTLAEKADGVHQTGEIKIDGLRDGAKLVYGVSIRNAADGRPRAEPFGNVRTTAAGAEVQSAREPLVDVFDEADALLVVAELPGVPEGEIEVELHGDLLSIRSTGERRYARELLLEQAVDAAGMIHSHRNGILEIRIPKVQP
jgi:HSP20 family protein